MWHFAAGEERRQADVLYDAHTEYAVKLLADRVADAAVPSGGDPAAAGLHQRILRDFSANIPVRALRLTTAEGLVIASTNGQEIGTTPAKRPAMADTEAVQVIETPGTAVKQAERILRSRVRPAASAPGVATGVTAAKLFVEAVVAADPPRSTLAAHAGALGTVLVVCGAMFAMVRCLRTQLRTAGLIAERLASSPEAIAGDIASLRLADCPDQVASAWNQLIEMATGLREEVDKSQAYTELSQSFESRRAGGGAALAQALNALPDGIIHITGESKFEYINTTAGRLLGWHEGKDVPRTLADATSAGAGQHILSAIRGALRRDGSFEPRSEVIEVDDGQSAYRVWITPMPGQQHQGECIVLVRDISQQLRAEKVREEFVTQVTHELRTPLTNIRAYAETLSSGMFDDPKVITDCYNVITKETRRLSRLIEDILSVSQMEVGSIELSLDDVDLSALLADAVRDVRGLADEKNMDVRLVLPKKPTTIKADRDKLAVVLNNLLGNAIKYTPADGTVVVAYQAAADQVSITVKDNGIGIDPVDHARVFEKFQRANDPDVLAETGSGIGLYTAREIVRRHGGNIELISKKGEGSTFVVRLPHEETRSSTLSVSQEA